MGIKLETHRHTSPTVKKIDSMGGLLQTS